MGNGVCSRRQRRIFQCLLLVTVVCGMMYGGMISYEMHKQLKRTEAMALKYQQHQESLSAQLQVVYEHRSRLEKSLQRERSEHKKAKEDYLVYKLESQQTLNKEKQDSNGKLNSLQVQHQMLKNQHEELKRQYYELQDQHQMQGDDHSRLLDEHRDRYSKLQQAKEGEITQLKDSVYNLREENKQLRKAHHDIHTQLQDTLVQHQDLKAAHEQLALTLEDHKSALAVAQAQVDEYKQIRESLNRVPNQAQLEQKADPQQLQAATKTPESPVHEAQPVRLEQPQKENHLQDNHQAHWDTESRLEHQDKEQAHARSELDSHPTVSQRTLSEREEDGDGEAERRRELAEEEMAQAGQPQKLEEDPDQPQDEQLEEEEEEEEEREQEQPDENALDRQKRHPQPEAQVQHGKSAYEQQQEQQRLEAQRAEQRRQIQMQQEALQAQRERVLKEREQRLKEEQKREELQHKEADRREQLLRQEHLRKRTEYENMDNDVVQGGEDHHTEDKEEGDVHMLQEEEDKQEVDHRVSPHQGAVDAEVDPENDPNNQGEDEFEEAEDDQLAHGAAREEEEVEEEEEEPAAAAQHVKTHPGPEQPAEEEELVLAGNPDQQEDALDDQYQEEVDEAQEDIAGGPKREEEEEEGVEEEEEDPYNEENVEQVGCKKTGRTKKGGESPNRSKGQ
ncbi:Golgi integral membrane protein 4a isoform X4 [Leuresthes tenuis]|uniref:Golgi integral membrane protein 4a isoform X4 n=1 Tax=Leuresthes tenuis TaxID=355514 RepID=UPI003B51084E